MSFDGDLVGTLTGKFADFLEQVAEELLNHDDEVFGNPVIDPESFVDPTATVTGEVRIGERVLVAPNVSIRADEGTPFQICPGSNFQDGAILHGHKQECVIGLDGERCSIWVGERTTVAHGAILHGPLLIKGRCFIGPSSHVWGSTIGNGCVIDDGAKVKNSTLGDGCMVGMNAVVRNVKIPNGMYIPDQAKVNSQRLVGRLTKVRPRELKTFIAKNKDIVEINHDLVEKHKRRARLFLEQRKKKLRRKIEKMLMSMAVDQKVLSEPLVVALLSSLLTGTGTHNSQPSA